MGLELTTPYAEPHFCLSPSLIAHSLTFQTFRRLLDSRPPHKPSSFAALWSVLHRIESNNTAGPDHSPFRIVLKVAKPSPDSLWTIVDFFYRDSLCWRVMRQKIFHIRTVKKASSFSGHCKREMCLPIWSNVTSLYIILRKCTIYREDVCTGKRSEYFVQLSTFLLVESMTIIFANILLASTVALLPVSSESALEICIAYISTSNWSTF